METPNEMENSCVGQHETVLTAYIAGTRDVTYTVTLKQMSHVPKYFAPNKPPTSSEKHCSIPISTVSIT
jgi:hypothetical protein